MVADVELHKCNVNEQHSVRHFRLTALVPRFSLRTLLLVVLVIAVLIALCPVAWRKFIIYRDGREYAALQVTKESFIQEARERKKQLLAAVDRCR